MLKEYWQKLTMYSREIFLGYGVSCFLLLGVGYFLQYVMGLIPCPLCIIQRFFFILTGISALIAWWRYDFLRERRVWSVISVVTVFLGMLAAIRLVWIQRFPPEGESVICLPPWFHSISDIARALQGTADCAERGFTIIFLSVSEWSLIAFIGLFTLSIVQAIIAFRRRE